MAIVEYYSIKVGEGRTIPLRIVHKDRTSFDLTGVTEIQVRFRKKDGTALIKTLVNIAPLSGGVTVVEALEGRILIDLQSLESELLKIGERQDFSVIVFKGNWAQVTDSGITIRSREPSSKLNGLQLNFDGVMTVDQVIASYNDSVNTMLEVMLTAGLGSTVLPVGVRTLTGGTNTGKRVANFRRSLSVEDVAV